MNAVILTLLISLAAAAADPVESVCLRENASDCTALGIILSEGRGAAKDEARARALLQRACDFDDGRGCTTLATMMAAGRGGPSDAEGAQRLLDRECQVERVFDPEIMKAMTGSAPAPSHACLKLGTFLLDGPARLRDPGRGYHELLERCGAFDHPGKSPACAERIGRVEADCTAGVAEACEQLGRAELGTAQSAEPSFADILKGQEGWLDQACALKRPAACAQLEALRACQAKPKASGCYLLFIRAPEEESAAAPDDRAWARHLAELDLRCRGGSGAACYSQYALTDPQALTRPDGKGKPAMLLQQACDLGSAQACVHLSQFEARTDAMAELRLLLRAVRLGGEAERASLIITLNRYCAAEYGVVISGCSRSAETFKALTQNEADARVLTQALEGTWIQADLALNALLPSISPAAALSSLKDLCGATLRLATEPPATRGALVGLGAEREERSPYVAFMWGAALQPVMPSATACLIRARRLTRSEPEEARRILTALCPARSSAEGCTDLANLEAAGIGGRRDVAAARELWASRCGGLSGPQDLGACARLTLSLCPPEAAGCDHWPNRHWGIRSMCEEGLSATARRAYLPAEEQPTLAAAAVNCARKPWSLPVAIPIEEAPSLGNVQAPVTIIEYGNFLNNAGPVIEAIRAKYGDRVRLVHKQYPGQNHHPSPLVAEAALAARDQGKFWEMHDLLLNHGRDRRRSDLDGYARQLGLDMTRFAAALDGHAHLPEITQETALAEDLGLEGDTFFVNGRRLDRWGQDSFEQAVEEALAVGAGGSRPDAGNSP